MRIALMTNNYKPFTGGVPISVERLAGGLRALGHEVTVFAPTYREQQEEEGVFRYATCLNHFIGGIVLPNPFDRRIEKEFEEHAYDIIHVHHPMLIGRTAAHLSKKFGIPLTFTYHTRYEQYVKCYTGLNFDRIMPLYLKSFLKQCSCVFAPTPGMSDYLTDVCGVERERVGILPTGIEEANFRVSGEQAEAVRKKYGAQDRPLMITVSRMASEKNVEFLLNSLAGLKRSFQKPFRMLMIGDGPDRAALERRALELGLGEEVVFTGAVPNGEIAPYFRAADAFLFASKTETQGIVVLEAFAGATPVIAVRATGVEDLVEDGKNGFLTVEDEAVYAAALKAFLDGRYDRELMSKNALCTGMQYREEAVARKAVRYYNSVVLNTCGREEEKWNRSIAF